jgi:hypothetical protein
VTVVGYTGCYTEPVLERQEQKTKTNTIKYIKNKGDNKNEEY